MPARACGPREDGEASIAQEKRNRVNDEIRAERLRLINEDGGQLGIVSVEEALAEAEQRGFDLVEMSPNADPPVCRLLDYGKFQFQQSKKRQAARRKQQQTQVKEVKFRPGTDDGDYRVKLRNLKRFLDHGHKIKVTVWFRGREMAHQELGAKLLERVEGDLEELAKVEQLPKLEGRRLAMVMTSRRPPAVRVAGKPAPEEAEGTQGEAKAADADAEGTQGEAKAADASAEGESPAEAGEAEEPRPAAAADAGADADADTDTDAGADADAGADTEAAGAKEPAGAPGAG